MAAGLRDNEPQSVHGRLLAHEWPSLPMPVRHLHDASVRRSFNGRCSIDRGVSLLARLIGAIMQFPPAANDVPLAIRIESHGQEEVWLRDFGGAPLRSRIVARHGLLIECMGPAAFAFRLEADDGTIRWRLVAMKVFGVPWPRRLCARIDASEGAAQGRYQFAVRVEMPLVGLLVHYRGWLNA